MHRVPCTVLLCLWSPLPDSSLAGQEHGRTIPLAEVVCCSANVLFAFSKYFVQRTASCIYLVLATTVGLDDTRGKVSDGVAAHNSGSEFYIVRRSIAS